MSKPVTVRCRGRIDHVGVSGTVLEVGGWIIADGGSPLLRMGLLVNGEPCMLEGASLNAASPGVAQAFPDAPGSDRARFHLRARAPAGFSGPEGLLVLGPEFESGHGSRLLEFMGSSIPLPPEAGVKAIGGTFLPVSLEFLGHFITLAGLRPGESVLDIGCGVGRMAYGLAHYLRPPGRYEGFDIMADLVAWAQKEIGSRHPNFQFRHVPVYNHRYNRSGTIAPDRFEFPYADGSFDFACLTSVFTHMRAPGLRHYLDEIGRVLRPGGRCLSTFFLLNEESRRLIWQGRSSQKIIYPWGRCRVARLLNPEHAVGYDERRLEGWLASEGFEMVSRHPGSWCGRSAGLSYQDILVFRKQDEPGAGCPDTGR